jgi:hypothetical protein
MAVKQRRQLTDEERAKRRERDREYARHAVDRLRSSEGWKAWLTAARAFTVTRPLSGGPASSHARNQPTSVDDMSSSGSEPTCYPRGKQRHEPRAPPAAH